LKKKEEELKTPSTFFEAEHERVEGYQPRLGKTESQENDTDNFSSINDQTKPSQLPSSSSLDSSLTSSSSSLLSKEKTPSADDQEEEEPDEIERIKRVGLEALKSKMESEASHDSLIDYLTALALSEKEKQSK